MKVFSILILVLCFTISSFAQEAELIYTHSGLWDYWDVGCDYTELGPYMVYTNLRIISEDSSKYYLYSYAPNNSDWWDHQGDLPDTLAFPLRDVDVLGLCDNEGRFWAMTQFDTPMFEYSSITDAVWSTSDRNGPMESRVFCNDGNGDEYTVYFAEINWSGVETQYGFDITGEMTKPYELPCFSGGCWWKDLANNQIVRQQNWQSLNTDTLSVEDNLVDIGYFYYNAFLAIVTTSENNYDVIHYDTYNNTQNNIYTFESDTTPQFLVNSQFSPDFNYFTGWAVTTGDQTVIYWFNELDEIQSFTVENTITRLRFGLAQGGWRSFYAFWSEYDAQADSTYLYRSNLYEYYSNVDSEPEAVPKSFEILSAYPNPFNGSTRIVYEIAEKSAVKISIFDILGKKVHSFDQNIRSSGKYSVLWNADNQVSGQYFIQLEAKEIKQVKSVQLVK